MNDPVFYEQYVKQHAKKTNTFVCCLKAFGTGGLICCISEAFFDLYTALGVKAEDTCAMLVSVTVMFITALLTGIGVFDRIAKHAGAGTLVPVSGFANSMISQAIDAKSEGFILGVGAKLFTVAGPVIVYGTAASFVYGIIHFIIIKMT